jgi:hypothetical protein
MLTVIGDYISDVAHDPYKPKARKPFVFPEIPGEEHRNPDLPQIREKYKCWDAHGNVLHE